MTEPRYQSGLRFRCTRCGHCCTGEAGFVWVNDQEIAAIAEHLGQPVEEFRALHVRRVGSPLSLREKANGECVLFDREKGCTVYAARPGSAAAGPSGTATSPPPTTGSAPARLVPARDRES